MLKNGFTLVEVIVAIFVILIGVLGTYAALQQIISYISFSNSKLTAVYLAQEGIEIVRNIRDANWLQEEDWDAGLNSGDWEADYTTTTFIATPEDSCGDGWNCNPYDLDNSLNLVDINGNGNNDFYSYFAGTSTKFKRKITIELVDTNNDGENDLKITVLVRWEEKGKIQEITVRENLYDWYSNI